MVARKHRTRVVLDTNVFVRNFTGRRRDSSNKRVITLWIQRRLLQLIVSREVIEEYLEIFEREVRMETRWLQEWRRRFESGQLCSVIGLARRYAQSRDPDDNVFLASAAAGTSAYLLTNDRDLLDLPEEFQRTLSFAIVTPREFLRIFEEE